MNVTKNSTSTNGTRSSASVSRQASGSRASVPRFGGVCGNVSENAAMTNDRIAPTRKIQRTCSGEACALSRNTNGQLTSTQPSVPPMRIVPKSRAGLLRFAKAIEFETDSVGTYTRLYARYAPKNGQKLVA